MLVGIRKGLGRGRMDVLGGYISPGWVNEFMGISRELGNVSGGCLGMEGAG